MLTSKSKTSSHKTLLKTSKIKDCPYCKSGLTETEKDFFPCSCSFQACIDCYKDIIHNKGLCPTCHNPLRLDKLNALNASKKEELIKADSERLLKKEASKKTTTVVVTAAPAKKTDNPNSIKVSTYSSNESAKFNLKKMNLVDLFKVRVLQRNLVYVIGLAPKIAKSDILDKFEHFGQYGKISKIIVNKNNAYNPSAINGPSYSAYLTFSNEVEASIAILAVDQFDIYDRTIRASYGTTKYCTFFLRDQACPNPDCLYLHKVGNERDSFIKDETNSNKSVFIDQQKMAVEHLQKHLTDIEKSITQQKNAKAVFPSLAIVRNKVKEYMAENAQKEKVEPKKEPVKVKPEEETKTAPKPHESVGEKSSPTKEKSASQSESNNKEEEVKIDDKSNVTPTKKKHEDAKEESAKSDLNESEGSSTSGRSAGKNENSPKKEDEQKQAAESAVKSDNEDAVESDTNNNNINETNCYLHIIRSFSRENKDDDTDIKNLEETPYHSEFDKKIFENIYVNWSNHTNSRFKVAQEENPDEPDEAAQTDGHPQSDFDIEFNVIYKSIQDYVHLPNTSHTGQPNRKVTEGEDNLQPPKTYPGWEENGQRNTNTSYNLFNGAFNQNITPNGIKANEEYGSSTGAGFGSDQISDQQDGADASASPDKKGSNSKTKRGKNKKKKGSNSKNSSETNTSSIKNMTDTNKYDKGFESLTLNN